MSTISSPSVYQNPFMAANNYSEIHLNSSQTDTFSVLGPAGFARQTVPQKVITPLGGIAGSIAVNSVGQLVTIRVGPQRSPNGGLVSAHTLMLLDPRTLRVLAERPLPSPPSTGVTFSGGGYFYLNNLGQVVCVTVNDDIEIYNVVKSGRNYKFVLANSFSLSGALNGSGDILNSVLPDSYGNLWFISHNGAVGYVNPGTGKVTSIAITSPEAPTGETISKSFATDGQGRVIVVTDYALYGFQATAAGGIQELWRAPYDRGDGEKPGQVQQGSGTTPTVFTDFAGNEFVTIADNADPLMHVNVYNAATGALVAQQAVFSNLPGLSDTENSLIAVNHSVIVENNYGNSTPASTLGPLTTQPGIDRVDFNPSTGQSQVTWENSTISVPSVVSQLSTTDGLLYTYAKDRRGWYWAALNYQTGAVVATARVPWSNLLLGAPANNFYGGITVGPDGTAYEGVFAGIVAWRPLRY